MMEDYSADQLRELARQTHDAKQAHRLLALAGIRDGLSRSETTRLGALDAQALLSVGIDVSSHQSFLGASEPDPSPST